VAPKRAPKRWVRLLETVRLLHRLLDKTLCEEAFRAVRSSERERKLSLFLLVRFWVAVLVRAPESLTQLLQEARKGGGVLVPALEATEEAFFQRCRDLSSKFFAELYRRFLARVLPEALPDYEGELGGLRSRFSAVCVIDGSRLDAVAHRLKILRDVRAPVLGGCVTAVYDLFRGITQGLFYYADAAVGEMRRVMEVLDAIPRGALTVNDRAYGNGKYFDALEERGLFGLVRRSRAWSLRTLEELGRIQRGGLVLVESVVEAGREEGAEPRVLRRFEVYRGRKRVLDLVTDVLDRRRLPMHQAIRLYGRRWTVERLFFDLKEVLNLHRFYAANPNAVAMQVYAAGLVHTAFRVAQARVARQVGCRPEDISTAKFFPRLAWASIRLAIAELTVEDLREANPGVRLRIPKWDRARWAQAAIEDILVEPRAGKRRRRRSRIPRGEWESFAHIPGARKALGI